MGHTLLEPDPRLRRSCLVWRSGILEELMPEDRLPTVRGDADNVVGATRRCDLLAL